MAATPTMMKVSSVTPGLALPCNFTVKYLPRAEQGLATSPVVLLLLQLQIWLVGADEDVTDVVVEIKPSQTWLSDCCRFDKGSALAWWPCPPWPWTSASAARKKTCFLPVYCCKAGLNRQTLVNLDKQTIYIYTIYVHIPVNTDEYHIQNNDAREKQLYLAQFMSQVQQEFVPFLKLWHLLIILCHFTSKASNFTHILKYTKKTL